MCVRVLCAALPLPHTRTYETKKKGKRNNLMSRKGGVVLILIECVCWVQKPSGGTRTKQPRKQQAHMYAREAKTHRKGKGEQGTHDALVESPHVCISFSPPPFLAGSTAIVTPPLLLDFHSFSCPSFSSLPPSLICLTSYLPLPPSLSSLPSSLPRTDKSARPLFVPEPPCVQRARGC